MSLAASISPHLPYLRRFSRALNGTQKGGDAYVAAVLEAIVSNPQSFDFSSDSRVALYRSFCRLWESIPLNLKHSANGLESPPRAPDLAQQRVSIVPPRAREAFLLMAVEGFSASATAEIMGLDQKEVAALIDEASAAILTQVATTVMIIEDEPLIAMEIQEIIGNLGHRVTGIARTHGQAVALAARKRPGLILADIQLADGSSGIEAVNQILRSFEVPVVFITAFPERLLTGDKPEPAFLITKPYTTEMVKAVVSQALFFGTTAAAAA